jgi:hypothetical protein
VKLDRDLVIAGLILQDWGKVWLLFDDATGTIKEPDWYPKAWGTKAVKLDRERLASGMVSKASVSVETADG